MKRILLVDDDPVITRIYQVGLSRRGFEVATAADGLEAIKALRANLPDIVVLDLMMPRLSGVEALRMIRQEPKWVSLPVVVLSNRYVDQATREAAALGAQKGLLKMGCTPALLAEVLNEVLDGKTSDVGGSGLLVALRDEQPERPAQVPPAPRPLAQPPTVATTVALAPAPATAGGGNSSDFVEKARQDFLASSGKTCGDLQSLFEAVCRSSTEQARAVCLHDFYRKVHFVTAGSALAGCRRVGQMASALEALLFGMLNKPAQVDPSLERTAGLILGFFPELFRHAAENELEEQVGSEILVIDDDPLAARLAMAALGVAKLKSRSVASPTEALRLLEQHRYDLILLDVEMPAMSGFELCRKLRTLPGCSDVPVIFITLHSSFSAHTDSADSGGDDSIAKPFVPMELAAKAVMHLLKRGLGRAAVPQVVPALRQVSPVPLPVVAYQ